MPDKPWGNAHRHIVYAGSFFAWKGVEELIAASRSLSGFRIMMIGGSESQAGLSGGASDGADMVLPGRLPHAEVMSRLVDACIAVLPNRDDTDSSFTSPIKLFEYMASGCAIVASDLPSIREILGPDEAEWVRPGDPAALAAGIRALSSDPTRARRLGYMAREKAKRYTWAARGERLYRLLERLGTP
jgi:glycosyltransferase involved in cell wall biosynthesis